jgi:branched-chain amino acid transport system permease protein
VVGLVLGLVLERGILQFMYHRDEVLIVLATFGSFLVLEDVILLVFGVNPYFAFQPMALLGSVELGGIARDTYGLTLIGLAVVLAIGCWLALKRTRWGKLLSAVIYDREISVAMGLNVTRVYIVTFTLGAMFGALGGAYIAPTVSVAPGFGIDVIVLSFAVVVIGGMGSVPGAMVGALAVGLVRALAVHKFPQFELFVIYAVMATVLVFRPEGMFAPAKARKI